MNNVVLIGRLTADPEYKQTPSGVSVTSFSIAVDRNYIDKDGNRQTDFINIAAWRNTADFICRYFSKGRMIAVEGSIQTRKYEDKNGNKRTVFEVIANRVFFCGDKPTKGTTGESIKESDFEEVPDDDLPF